MKSIIVEAPYKLKIIEKEMPIIKNPDDVLIKVKVGGICGTDVHIYHGTLPVATYPRIIGHEIVGEVVRTGDSATKYSKGDHVTVDPVISCGNCYPCSIGRNNVCENLKVRGANVDGGYQEYIVVPHSSIYKFPKEISWEEAVMIEPFAVAAQVISRGGIKDSDIVYIIGAGPTGLSILQVAKNTGATCIISDMIDSRLSLAKSMGADLAINASNGDITQNILDFTRNLRPSVVIDAVGTANTFEDVVKIVSAAGRVVLLSFNDKPSKIRQLDITKSELDIRGSRLNCNKFPQVIEWFGNKRIDVKSFISHRYHFTKIKEAFEMIEKNLNDLYKVILKFD